MICGRGVEKGLMITTLDIVPALQSFSSDQRYHCCVLFTPPPFRGDPQIHLHLK